MVRRLEGGGLVHLLLWVWAVQFRVGLRGGVGRARAAFEVFKAALEIFTCGVSGRVIFWGNRERTVVALGNAVLDPTTLGEVGDLGPVLVGVGGEG